MKDFIKLLQDNEYFFHETNIERIFQEDKNPFFCISLTLYSGLVNPNRQPYPRIYTQKAVSDCKILQLGVESRFGHLWKPEDSLMPVGKVAGSYIEEDLVDSMLYSLIYVQPEEIRAKISTGIISAVSIDYIGDGGVDLIDGEYFEVIDNITKVNSVDFVNNDRKGVQNARIIDYGSAESFVAKYK